MQSADRCTGCIAPALAPADSALQPRESMRLNFVQSFEQASSSEASGGEPKLEMILVMARRAV
jgi:hypothetical protein